MWYEDGEEEKQPAAQAQQHATADPDENPISGHHAKGFPANADPTKAFEDDGPEYSGGPASDDEIGALKHAVKELDEKANLNYDRYLRALAELENYKKRMARERMEQLRYAGEDLLRELLPVIDNLERTLAHTQEITDINKVVEGIVLIQRQFLKVLEKSGVSIISQAPCPFDPAIHQALERVEDKSRPDDTVVEILQKGYLLNGKVIRPAMVKVSKHP